MKGEYEVHCFFLYDFNQPKVVGRVSKILIDDAFRFAQSLHIHSSYPYKPELKNGKLKDISDTEVC